jgi:PKD repeat protein
MRSSLRALAVVVGVAAGWGCLDDSITGERPLTIQLTVAPASALVTETVTATFEATGSGIQGVILDWGDGLVDSLVLSGRVVEAASDLDHIYGVSGTFTVTAIVEDQTGTDSASRTVEIN